MRQKLTPVDIRLTSVLWWENNTARKENKVPTRTNDEMLCYGEAYLRVRVSWSDLELLPEHWVATHFAGERYITLTKAGVDFLRDDIAIVLHDTGCGSFYNMDVDYDSIVLGTMTILPEGEEPF